MEATYLQLDETTKKAFSIAQAIAKENMHAAYEAAHLLMALLNKDVLLEPWLTEMDIDVYYLKDWADVRLESCAKSKGFKETIPAAAVIDTILNEADSIRATLDQDELLPLHLLVAISTPGVAFSFDQLRTFSLTREMLLNAAKSDSAVIQELLGNTEPGDKKKLKAENASSLGKFCVDKTELAKQQKIDPIIGREQETRTIEAIFARRLKPNVLIVGEPGVGKSALVDGFAIDIAEKKVPLFLQSSSIYELNVGALVAGASYKGEIEERLNNIISDLKKQDKAILFIDEIHAFLDKSGAVANAANLLKPELARGAITLIGATTMDEYRKFIEPDEAFARRFELLQINEPDVDTAFRMMKGTATLYQQHHSITVPDETLKETIRLAKRYIKDRKLPDAAVDLMDRSMAALRLTIETSADIVARNKENYIALTETENTTCDDYKWHYTQLKNNLNPIVWSELQLEEDVISITEVDPIKTLLADIYKRLETIVPVDRSELLVHDVAAIVADKTGIPIGKIQAQEKERLMNMTEILKQRVVGQDYAIAAVSEAILESRAGLGKPGQPMGSFFFLGPTGTGKTELAKGLAEFLFQSETNIIRFDMSEFKEEHSAALLYGSPPGYVGYEEGGLLVNKIREQPYSIVLFDEIEKAHHSVFDVFLQIMDEGKLHDKLGKEGDFSNALILFTSNIGSQYITEQFGKGHIPGNNELLEIMGKHFRPEFLGRVTEIVPFSPMTQEMVENIFSIQMKSLYKALDKEKIGLTVTEAARKKLALLGFTPQFGARPLNSVIRNHIRRPLAKRIIGGTLQPNAFITLDFKNEEFIWK